MHVPSPFLERPPEIFVAAIRARSFDALTARHEADRTDPWSIADAPAGHIDALIDGIIGFRLRPHTLVGAWKLDQHKREADRHGAARGLRDESEHARLARWMENPAGMPA